MSEYLWRYRRSLPRWKNPGRNKSDNRNRCVKMNNAVIQSLVRCAASEDLETRHSLSLPSLYANAIKTNFERKCVLIFFFKKSQRNPTA